MCNNSEKFCLVFINILCNMLLCFLSESDTHVCAADSKIRHLQSCMINTFYLCFNAYSYRNVEQFVVSGVPVCAVTIALCDNVMKCHYPISSFFFIASQHTDTYSDLYMKLKLYFPSMLSRYNLLM